MKKYVTISLFIFFAITVSVLAADLIRYDKNNQSKTSSITTDTGQIDTLTNLGSGTTSLNLSKTELAKHNSANSCWLLVSGKIYDVTSFINAHPGGAKEILPTCGTDATAAYASRGGTGSHSSSATAMLADYYIGDLNQTVKTSVNPLNPSGQATPAIANPSAVTNPPTSSRDDGDDEFDD